MRAVLLLLFCLFTRLSQATNYYSDPSAAGKMSNPGTAAAPWANLSSVFSANKTFLPGDTIFLRTGNHGYTIIKGVNTDFVVIAPEPGHQPIVPRIRVSSTASTTAAYWKLYGLMIQSESTGTNAVPSYNLIEIYPYASHITISHCTITSNLNTAGWTRDDWRNRCNNGLSTRGKLNAFYIIENNLIQNVAFGLTISSSNTIVRGNTVQYFTNDGSRVLGSDILFEKNRVLDLIKVMTTAENHDDLFQSFVYPAGGTGQDTLKNNRIRQNIFINTTDTTRAFRGNTQGIGCFDGVYLNWVIENNIVMTDHWHGISMYGAVNCRITNNTVIDPYLVSPVDPYDNNATNIGPTWILISKKTNGPPSSGNVVSNNLVANKVLFTTPEMGTGSKNIVLGALSNFSNFFVDVADMAVPINFDLHLLPGCSAIDAGDTLYAPGIDFEGVIRPQGAGIDVGAYEYLDSIPTSSVLKIEAIQALRIYPNPSQGTFQLLLEGFDQETEGILELFSSLGEKVFTTQCAQTSSTSVDLPRSLPKGMYWVQFWEGQHCFVGKLVLQ
jgi:parallel beta-helix repeat protein